MAAAKLLDHNAVFDPFNPSREVRAERPGIDLFTCADRRGLGEHRAYSTLALCDF